MTLRQQFDSLATADVHRYVHEGQEENLHLEFKELTDDELSRRDDRKNLAKALSGFANSAGGIVIWGVEARPDSDGVDRASSAKPVANAARLISRLNELTGAAVSPIVDGVLHKPLLDGENGGFAASLIPESLSGPHMAKMGEDRYFKRSGDSFYKMEHYDIADMFGRRRRPRLELIGVIDKKGLSGTSDSVVSLLLSIVNSGRGSATAPFLRVDPPDGVRPCFYGVDGNRNHGLPQYPNPVFGHSRSYGSNSNFVLHPGARIDVTRLNVLENLGSDLRLPYALAAEDMALVEGTLEVPKSEIIKFAG